LILQKLARTVTSAQDTDANAQRARKSVVLARSSVVDRRKSSEETNLWKAERSKSASEDAGTAANALDRDKKRLRMLDCQQGVSVMAECVMWCSWSISTVCWWEAAWRLTKGLKFDALLMLTVLALKDDMTSSSHLSHGTPMLASHGPYIAAIILLASVPASIASRLPGYY